MATRQLLYRAFATFVTLRVIYALALLLPAYFELWGLGHPMSGESYFIVLVNNLTPLLFFLWTAYVLAYAAGSLGIWMQSRFGLYAYLAGAAIDFGLWSYSSFSHNYQATFGGRAASIDMVFNLIDLTIIAVLLLLWSAKRLR